MGNILLYHDVLLWKRAMFCKNIVKSVHFVPFFSHKLLVINDTAIRLGVILQEILHKIQKLSTVISTKGNKGKFRLNLTAVLFERPSASFP